VIRVAVNGARGRMGALVCEALAAEAGFSLVARCGRGDDLPAALRAARPDVVVDFTLPAAVRECALAIVDAGARPVIGTSGLDAAGRDELARRCEAKRLGGVVAPNFAIGALLMMRFAALAARHLGAAEIREAHHPGKLDAPSATALATAEAIASARPPGRPLPAPPAPPDPARGLLHAGVPIHSTRLPGILAEQSVLFGAPGQKLVVEHVTYGREAYLPGVLLACRRVLHLDRLVLSLDRLLFDGEV